MTRAPSTRETLRTMLEAMRTMLETIVKETGSSGSTAPSSVT